MIWHRPAARQRLGDKYGPASGFARVYRPRTHQRTAAGRSIDLFALGVLLYEALSAELPFSGRNPHETLTLIARGEHKADWRARAGSASAT